MWLVREGGRADRPGRRWARQAARGESIAIISQLAPVAPKMSEQAITALADQVVGILAAGSPVGRRSAGTAAAGELDDATADLLFPARSWAEIERRAEVVAAGAGQASDAELYDVLFAGHAFRDTRRADAAGPPGHVEYGGES